MTGCMTFSTVSCDDLEPDVSTPTLSPPPGRVRQGSRLPAPLALVRPRQWVKNLLVFAAPLAAGALLRPDIFAASVLAFVAFTMAASGTYALNDVADRHADAVHPTKRFRPIASGAIGAGPATVLGVALLIGSVVVPILGGSLGLAGMVAAYVVLTTTYSNWLKHVPLFDIAIVAAGFLLRAMAGAVAADLPMSRWFLVVAGFASLYVVANKRAAEFREQSDDGATRKVLLGYSNELLREIRFTSGAVTIAGYVSWAFDQRADSLGGDPWATLTIVPFVLGVFRYAADVDAGLGEAPEEILLRDRVLMGVGAVWLVLFAVAVHAA